jgi:hypothetical protein
VTVGTGVPVGLEPVLELERVVAGLDGVVTGLETCVDARAGALA